MGHSLGDCGVKPGRRKPALGHHGVPSNAQPTFKGGISSLLPLSVPPLPKLSLPHSQAPDLPTIRQLFCPPPPHPPSLFCQDLRSSLGVLCFVPQCPDFAFPRSAGKLAVPSFSLW